MQIHNVVQIHKNKKHKTVGRGGKRGKTAGRGTKGQNARSGRKKRPEMRDIIKKIPKMRGYTFKSHQIKPRTVSFRDLAVLGDNAVVNPEALLKAGLVVQSNGKIPKVKILSVGTPAKGLKIEGCLLSAKAKELILGAGGSVA